MKSPRRIPLTKLVLETQNGRSVRSLNISGRRNADKVNVV